MNRINISPSSVPPNYNGRQVAVVLPSLRECEQYFNQIAGNDLLLSQNLSFTGLTSKMMEYVNLVQKALGLLRQGLNMLRQVADRKLWARKGEGAADVVPSRSQFGNHLRASARCVLVAWAIRNLADGARTEQSLTQRGLVIRPKTPRRLPQSCVGVFAQDRDGEMPTNRLSDSTRPLFATNARHAGVSCAFCFKGTVLIRSSAFWPQFAARRLYEVY